MCLLVRYHMMKAKIKGYMGSVNVFKGKQEGGI